MVTFMSLCGTRVSEERYTKSLGKSNREIRAKFDCKVSRISPVRP